MYEFQMKWELLPKFSLNFVIVHVFPGSLSLAGARTVWFFSLAEPFNPLIDRDFKFDQGLLKLARCSKRQRLHVENWSEKKWHGHFVCLSRLVARIIFDLAWLLLVVLLLMKTRGGQG